MALPEPIRHCHLIANDIQDYFLGVNTEMKLALIHEAMERGRRSHDLGRRRFPVNWRIGGH